MIRRIVSPKLVLLVRTTRRIHFVVTKDLFRLHPTVVEGVDEDNLGGRDSTVTTPRILETAHLLEEVEDAADL